MGEDLISSPTEDNKRARVLDAIYDSTRQALLRSYVWNFAKTRANLAASTEAVAFGFSYKALLPVDCLKWIGVYDESEPGYQVNYTGARVPHKVEGRYVLSDSNPIKGFYIKDVTDPEQFDPLFTATLSALLAVNTCLAITADKGISDITGQIYRDAIKLARTANAMEGTPEHYEASEFLDARQYGGGRGPFRLGPVNW
jgi:hypothetical protein